MTGRTPGANSPESSPLLDSNVKTAEKTCFKVIKSGKLIEVYKSEVPFKSNANVVDIMPRFEKGDSDKERKLEYEKRSRFRAKNKIKRLLYANFIGSKSKFITLTFNDNQDFDIRDLKVCYVKLKAFLHRMRYRFGEFDYLIVPEYQMKYDRGAVHYHLVCNIGYIENKFLAEIWTHGFTKINLIGDGKKVAGYLSKYISKDLSSSDKGLKRYYRSKKLKDEVVIYGKRAEALSMLMFTRYDNYLQYMSEYMSENNGMIRYYEYNFNKKGGVINDSNSGSYS